MERKKLKLEIPISRSLIGLAIFKFFSETQEHSQLTDYNVSGSGPTLSCPRGKKNNRILQFATFADCWDRTQVVCSASKGLIHYAIASEAILAKL